MNHSPVENKLEILRTERLILTRIQAEHEPALVELWTDPDVTRFMGGPRERDFLVTEFEKNALAPFAEKYDLWALVEKETGSVIGHCGLLDKEVEGTAEIELVYVLAIASWGKGYASEIAAALREYAFYTFGLTRLISLIEPENAASERVAQKAGMHFEREITRPGGAARRIYAVESTRSR
jgi:ribosomal-protein-alanine N-acetyltransferase